MVCPGSQNDVSVYGNLLLLSTDSRRTDDSCAAAARRNPPRTLWEGIKLFDISNPGSPRYIAAVKTDCGSHTQTMMPCKGRDLSVYVSSYSPAAPRRTARRRTTRSPSSRFR